LDRGGCGLLVFYAAALFRNLNDSMSDYKRKLSLAVIYGNVENIMERFLRSFVPLVDEIILVRAIGASRADESKEIAISTLKELGKPYMVTVYENAEGNHWPHVDDFAAARQMAFDLTSNEWVMWADTDDILDPAFIPIIRRALDGLEDGFTGIQFPYEVPEDALTVMRERIVRKDAWKWQSPIHECLMPTIENAAIGTLNSVKIVHAPISHRAPNNERNMRILESIPEAERTISQRFHYMQTLDLVGRHDEAMNEAAKLAQDPKTPKVEKYQIYCFLAKGSSEPLRSQFYLQAVATDPTRREAYAELCKGAFARQEPEEMLAWARCLKAQPKPHEWPWNARRTLWGREGVEAHAMALRANLDLAGADTLELNHFKANGAKISLLHATRGRFQQAAAARRKWLEKAANQDAIEHIFAIDEDDEQSVQYLTLWRHVIVMGTGGPVRAWNKAAERSHGEILIQLSDDWEPPMHWDRMILERIGDTSKPAVLQVSDGHRTDDLMCMAILTRARYLDQRYLFHPDFFSMYSDNWFSKCAHRDGVVIDARDLVFEHLHPVHGKGEIDAVYARSNAEANYKAGEQHYGRLQDGAISSWDVEGWCDFRDLYTAIAKALPDGATVAEIGVWKGQSVIHLAQRMQDMGKRCMIHAIDTFQGDEDTGKEKTLVQFTENIERAGVGGIVYPLPDQSIIAATRFEAGELDMVFIDGAHDYDSVYSDLTAWWPRVKDGGILAGHDIDSPDVQRALEDAGIEYHVVGRCWVRKNRLNNAITHSQEI
jgi:tetratricopeptide (TPR) repeat protein